MDFLDKIYNWVKIAKPEWELEKTPSTLTKSLLNAIIKEEINEVFDGIEEDNHSEILDGIVDSFWVLINVLVAYNISIDKLKDVIQKVEESNYSKFCKTEEEAIQSVFLYGMGQHPDKMGVPIETYFKKINENYYAIFRKADNKILKNYLYKKVII